MAEKKTDKQVIFLASFPTLQAALKISGDGTGMRIILDIPENQMSEAVKLMLYRQVVLKVTIEPDEQAQKQANGNGTTEGKPAGSRTLKRTSTRR